MTPTHCEISQKHKNRGDPPYGDKEHLQNLLHSERLRDFPPKIRNKAGHSVSPLSFRIVLVILDSAIRQGKETEGMQVRGKH